MGGEAKCEICGEPMPAGEEMFKFHGYSGPCPRPPLPRPPTLESLLRMTVEIDSPVTGKKVQMTPPFCVSVQGERNGGVHFIIHANGYDSDTLDFIVKGNRLEQI